MVGKVQVGSEAPVSVQSMTTTQTTDINGTLQQIAELTATGCDIVRVAVPTQEDADVLRIIAKRSQIPVIADIHFQPRYVNGREKKREINKKTIVARNKKSKKKVKKNKDKKDEEK